MGPTMGQSRNKKKSRRAGNKRVPRLSQLDPGMPALDSVREVVDFESPKGDKYKILKTTETDGYDPPLGTPKKRGRRSVS
jgi:hypothetical protein